MIGERALSQGVGKAAGEEVSTRSVTADIQCLWVPDTGMVLEVEQFPGNRRSKERNGCTVLEFRVLPIRLRDFSWRWCRMVGLESVELSCILRVRTMFHKKIVWVMMWELIAKYCLLVVHRTIGWQKWQWKCDNRMPDSMSTNIHHNSSTHRTILHSTNASQWYAILYLHLALPMRESTYWAKTLWKTRAFRGSLRSFVTWPLLPLLLWKPRCF